MFVLEVLFTGEKVKNVKIETKLKLHPVPNIACKCTELSTLLESNFGAPGMQIQNLHSYPHHFEQILGRPQTVLGTVR